MISLVVPTRNRAHTLRIVAPSYFAQADVDEIVFVSDAGDDDTEAVLRAVARAHPAVRMQFLRNARRLGASQSRNIGVQACSNDFVLFCDDDEFLEAGYARTCLAKLLALGAGAVSGRRVYMEVGETTADALRRFGTGLRNAVPFRPVLCEYVNGARFLGDRQQPITNAIILTRRSLLLQYPFDAAYARGNGYREESDYQMNLFVHGHAIWVTNDCHSLHLPLSQVRTGGQRTQTWRRLVWSVHYTRYFYGKYYAAYAARLGLRTPRWLALAAFTGFSVYRELLRPPLHALAMALLRRRARLAAAATR
ncbi:glycosyltransferase family 2 protein [Rubrivivax sp. RP6-9]|uniref:glycosyltransferase family 2 protein n=1 Tax=Rubrivivax sp. RP6-9 TaxID=3415750 RepID=UPI003CC6248C